MHIRHRGTVSFAGVAFVGGAWAPRPPRKRSARLARAARLAVSQFVQRNGGDPHPPPLIDLRAALACWTYLSSEMSALSCWNLMTAWKACFASFSFLRETLTFPT